MVNRFQKLSNSDDLFLFGARGTGKSTLIRTLFSNSKVLWIDLLSEEDEERFGRHPDELSKHLRSSQYQYVVIDEIQKFPKLLDIVHSEIERKSTDRPFFILTGSSARKLKKSGANLLGGRAFTYFLFPFTHFELGSLFHLQSALEYGTLPLVWARPENEKKEEFLRGYVRNYLKEEILAEQILRQIEPFKDFLEVAAQMNAEIINYSKMARDVGVSDQTIKSFFSILEDTLIGYSLPSFHRSVRKRQREAPKFYFFDTGVRRALARNLKVPLSPKTSEYGKAFEHFIILEIFRACEYAKNDFKLSYLRTKDDAEIDLIIERPGRPDLLLEIKSANYISEDETRILNKFFLDWGLPCEAQVWSLDPLSKKIQNVDCLHWQEGIRRIFKP